MVEAARAGGAIALDHYRRGVSVTLKADRSPVTDADHEAERAIVEVLAARCPDHGFLGEELGGKRPGIGYAEIAGDASFKRGLDRLRHDVGCCQ